MPTASAATEAGQWTQSGEASMEIASADASEARQEQQKQSFNAGMNTRLGQERPLQSAATAHKQPAAALHLSSDAAAQAACTNDPHQSAAWVRRSEEDQHGQPLVTAGSSRHQPVPMAPAADQEHNAAAGASRHQIADAPGASRDNKAPNPMDVGMTQPRDTPAAGTALHRNTLPMVAHPSISNRPQLQPADTDEGAPAGLAHITGYPAGRDSSLDRRDTDGIKLVSTRKAPRLAKRLRTMADLRGHGSPQEASGQKHGGCRLPTIGEKKTAAPGTCSSPDATDQIAEQRPGNAHDNASRSEATVDARTLLLLQRAEATKLATANAIRPAGLLGRH